MLFCPFLHGSSNKKITSNWVSFCHVTSFVSIPQLLLIAKFSQDDSICYFCSNYDYNVQVFTFGSVPLKTYLPDGDIDLTAFSKNQNLKETWAHQVRDMLESEEKNENAEFRVKEVQYIKAEVGLLSYKYYPLWTYLNILVSCLLPILFYYYLILLRQ